MYVFICFVIKRSFITEPKRKNRKSSIFKRISLHLRMNSRAFITFIIGLQSSTYTQCAASRVARSNKKKKYNKNALFKQLIFGYLK